jgi:hypothetical protein
MKGFNGTFLRYRQHRGPVVGSLTMAGWLANATFTEA